MSDREPSQALYDLARRIDRAIDDNRGILECYEVGPEEFSGLLADQIEYNGGVGLAAKYPRFNFIWRGTPVCARTM